MPSVRQFVIGDRLSQQHQKGPTVNWGDDDAGMQHRHRCVGSALSKVNQEFESIKADPKAVCVLSFEVILRPYDLVWF
jgi:hypothetical protein